MAGLPDGVILLLVKVAQLVVDLGEVVELEMNPVLASTAGVTVGAAQVRVAATKRPAHERLAIRPYPRRLTQIDYDREMALVAVRQWPDQPPEGCGVARIISDPDREQAEFAIILLREATGIGLSNLLLRRLIQYACDQGIRELFGEILRENEPMLELCRAMGFTVKVCPEDAGVMIATLRLVSG